MYLIVTESVDVLMTLFASLTRLPVQVKLLRVLEDKTIQRVGSNNSIPIDARIITAFHKNLDALIEQG
jgi:transcriptional regulator with PAS, ATPase and Fis domain